VAQPIQEPSGDRELEGLGFRSRQLFRRPSQFSIIGAYFQWENTSSQNVSTPNTWTVLEFPYTQMIANVNAFPETCAVFLDGVCLAGSGTGTEFTINESVDTDVYCTWTIGICLHWNLESVTLNNASSPWDREVQIGCRVNQRGVYQECFSMKRLAPDPTDGKFYDPYNINCQITTERTDALSTSAGEFSARFDYNGGDPNYMTVEAWHDMTVDAGAPAVARVEFYGVRHIRIPTIYSN
jgi:hypothetical protein